MNDVIYSTVDLIEDLSGAIRANWDHHALVLEKTILELLEGHLEQHYDKKLVDKEEYEREDS